ncbi:MAG: hypothetical protein ACU84H_17560 [Gammaproteobacteria bacterium]
MPYSWLPSSSGSLPSLSTELKNNDLASQGNVEGLDQPLWKLTGFTQRVINL